MFLKTKCNTNKFIIDKTYVLEKGYTQYTFLAIISILYADASHDNVFKFRLHQIYLDTVFNYQLRID